MKTATIRINRVELRLRGGAANTPAQLAERVAREIARRGSGPLPAPLQTALGQRLAAPLTGVRRK